MRYKSNKILVTLFISIILIFTVTAMRFLPENKTKEITNYIEKDVELTLVKNNTSIDIINESTHKLKKGPIPSSAKKAYITIDDGPSKYTNDILNILEKNDVKATFFMIDTNMKKYPQNVKKVEGEGHSVGFHSVTHDIDKLYKTPEDTLNEFETCKETLYNITGKISKLIRLPYGSKPYMPKDSRELLLKHGYKIWDWNLDTQDWRATKDNIVSNILYYGRNNPNLIILMHEKQQTVEALDSMIMVLKERGYEILPITEDIQERNFWDKNL